MENKILHISEAVGLGDQVTVNPTIKLNFLFQINCNYMNGQHELLILTFRQLFRIILYTSEKLYEFSQCNNKLGLFLQLLVKWGVKSPNLCLNGEIFLMHVFLYFLMRWIICKRLFQNGLMGKYWRSHSK
jgi:hypothetical protein